MFFIVGETGCDSTIHAFCNLFIFILYAVDTCGNVFFDLNDSDKVSGGFNRKKTT